MTRSDNQRQEGDSVALTQKKHKPEKNEPLFAMGSSAMANAKLRQADVLLSQGCSVAETVRSIGVTQFTYCRWRKEFGGLKTDQVKRLKELESEASSATGSSEMPSNERLRKAVSDLTLEKLILREAASGNF